MMGAAEQMDLAEMRIRATGEEAVGGGYFGGGGGSTSVSLISSGAGGSSYVSGHSLCTVHESEYVFLMLSFAVVILNNIWDMDWSKSQFSMHYSQIRVRSFSKQLFHYLFSDLHFSNLHSSIVKTSDEFSFLAHTLFLKSEFLAFKAVTSMAIPCLLNSMACFSFNDLFS